MPCILPCSLPSCSWQLPPSLAARKLCLLNKARHTLYTVQSKIDGLSSTDSKIYALLILGRLIQSISFVSLFVSMGLLLYKAPVAAIGVGIFLPMGLIGSYLSSAPDQACQAIRSRIMMERPFVPGQPIGLINNHATCCINAILQLLMQAPHLLDRFNNREHFQQFRLHYQTAERHFTTVSEFNTRCLREDLNALSIAGEQEALPLNAQQMDACDILKALFSNPPLYQFRETTDGRLRASDDDNQIPLLSSEPFISLLIPEQLPQEFSLQSAFNAMLDYHTTDTHQHRQSHFSTLPTDLLISPKRFLLRPVPPTIFRPEGGWETRKIETPIPTTGILELGRNHIHEGTSDVRYTCDAFIEHIGIATFGHYVAFVKREEQWWLCDDLRVIAVPQEYAMERMQQAYVLHFKQASPSPA